MGANAQPMTLRIKSPQDAGAAIILIAIGLAGLWFGRDYDIGNMSRMGPGYMPMLLSIGLLVFGAVIGLRSVTIDGPPIEPGRWHPSLLILVAVLLFALLIDRAGLALTTFVVAMVCACASADVKWKQTVALGMTLAFFCVVVFVYGLRQPIPVFGSG
jgi:Tripartite tricarboxylate transporter TctB family